MAQQPRPRAYYSQRNAPSPESLRLDLEQLKQLFLAVYKRFTADGYFQQAFGYECVDTGENLGFAGDPAAFFLLRLRRGYLWPVEDRLRNYSEHELFDVVEILFDVVSKPESNPSAYHSYNNCGWQYQTFDKQAGEEEYRTAINEFLGDYSTGYELSNRGEILSLGQLGQRELLMAELPHIDPANIEARVDAARTQFRRYGSSLEDRRNAVRLLADVLEYLRPRLKGVITSRDEADLFNIANNFGVRHHNDRQKTDYDQELWLGWMFYYYLNTIAVVTKKLAGPLPKPELWDGDDLVAEDDDLPDLPF